MIPTKCMVGPGEGRSARPVDEHYLKVLEKRILAVLQMLLWPHWSQTYTFHKAITALQRVNWNRTSLK